MKVLLPKLANRFRVYFDQFGSGDELVHLNAQVLRVTRPHLLTYNVYGAGDPIEIDLRDDVRDITRAEVLTQLNRQRKNDDATFAVRIVTIADNEQILEQWHLSKCRIVDCHFDELSYAEAAGLVVRLRFDVKNVSVNIGHQMVVMLGETANLQQ